MTRAKSVKCSRPNSSGLQSRVRDRTQSCGSLKALDLGLRLLLNRRIIQGGNRNDGMRMWFHAS